MCGPFDFRGHGGQMEETRMLRWILLWSVFAVLMMGGHALAAAPNVVIYASDVTTLKGNWTKKSTSGAAGGQSMSSTDRGWSSPDAPLASPPDYFEASFSAPAGTAYRVW